MFLTHQGQARDLSQHKLSKSCSPSSAANWLRGSTSAASGSRRAKSMRLACGVSILRWRQRITGLSQSNEKDEG